MRLMMVFGGGSSPMSFAGWASEPAPQPFLRDRSTSVPSPPFDTRPDQSISPDWCRFGVSPRNAPTSVTRLNRSGLSTRAMKLSAFTGPTPGMVMRRHATGWAFAFFFTALSRSSAAWHSVEWVAINPSAMARSTGSVSPAVASWSRKFWRYRPWPMPVIRMPKVFSTPRM